MGWGVGRSEHSVRGPRFHPPPGSSRPPSHSFGTGGSEESSVPVRGRVSVSVAVCLSWTSRLSAEIRVRDSVLGNRVPTRAV